MDGIQKMISEEIVRLGRGSIIFAQDFSLFGTAESVRQALCSLVIDGMIVRVARGVYCYPRVAGEYSIQTLYPSKEEIAYAVAARSKVRIVPCSDRAAYMMGFTGFNLGENKYLTDGAPRRIGQKGGDIIFMHTSEMRIFSFENTTMQLLSLAIRAAGQDGITPDMKECIRYQLSKVPGKELEHDIKLCPVWVADLLLEL